jgi:hypothetical protein
MARSATASDLRETSYGIGIALHETNQQRRLRVWLGPALLPALQRSPFATIIFSMTLAFMLNDKMRIALHHI